MFDDLPEYRDSHYKRADSLVSVARIGEYTTAECCMPNVIVKKNYNHIFTLIIIIDVITGKVEANEIDDKLDVLMTLRIKKLIRSYEKCIFDIISMIP